MPDFSIDGNPEGIRSRASTMRTKGDSFVSVGDALARISTDGWTGRAADHFRDSFDSEPTRWREAGNGFITAASALETFASELEDAQRRAREAESEYGRGDAVTFSARQEYDADVNRARNEVDAATARGDTMTLTILPFHDPGESIRDGALSAYSSAKADLETAGHACATAVRAGCAAAPEKRKWWESGLAAIGGFFAGAGEAVWDLVTLPGSPISMLMDSIDLASGHLTPEEMAIKYKLGIEQVGDILGALKDDPLEFGKNIGKAMLDWDTWADDPARALGHLVPDAVIAVLTAGTGAVATRGAKGGIDGLEALTKMDDLAAIGKLDDLGDLGKLDDLADLGKLDDLGDGRLYDTFDDGVHRTDFAPEQLGDNSAIDDVLHDVGMSRDELIDKINTPVSELSAADRAALTQVRDAIPAPDATTVMQKVLTPDQFQRYLLDPQSAHPDWFDPSTIGGSVTRAGDTAHLGTPDALHDGLRLDYPGTPFAPGDTSSHVIRFTTPDSFEAPRFSELGGPGKYDAGFDDPFTGNGFTKAGDDIIPEWQPSQANGGPTVNMNPGAEMWEVLDNGNQRLVGVLDNGGQWVPVG